MARNRKHFLETDYLSLLLSGEYERKSLQSFALVDPESAVSKKIREALAVHALIIAAGRLIDLRKQQSITTT